MAYHDSDMELLDKCCQGCKLSGIAEKLDTLVYDLSNEDAYSGELLTSAEIGYLNGMCSGTANLGTILSGVLTAAKNYDVATAISDATKLSLNNCCAAFHTNLVGTAIDACITLINSFQEYDESFVTDFYFTGYSDYPATIDDDLLTISVELPAESVVTALVANFTSSTGSSVLDGETVLESGSGEIDYTSPVTLTCVSKDEQSTNDYVVTVTVVS